MSIRRYDWASSRARATERLGRSPEVVLPFRQARRAFRHSGEIVPLHRPRNTAQAHHQRMPRSSLNARSKLIHDATGLDAERINQEMFELWNGRRSTMTWRVSFFYMMTIAECLNVSRARITSRDEKEHELCVIVRARARNAQDTFIVCDSATFSMPRPSGEKQSRLTVYRMSLLDALLFCCCCLFTNIGVKWSVHLGPNTSSLDSSADV